MNTDQRLDKLRSVFIFLSAAGVLAACSPKPTPAVFVPPAISTSTSAPTAPPLTPTPTLPSPTAEAAQTSGAPPCENNLSFMEDLTVPDGSVIAAGGSIDKQWLVQNSGTCNWDGTYRLRLVGGDSLGALTDQALYPARAGTQATLRVLFTAPTLPGTYQSAWQAIAPDGSAFGDAVFIQIVVSE